MYQSCLNIKQILFSLYILTYFSFQAILFNISVEDQETNGKLQIV